ERRVAGAGRAQRISHLRARVAVGGGFGSSRLRMLRSDTADGIDLRLVLDRCRQVEAPRRSWKAVVEIRRGGDRAAGRQDAAGGDLVAGDIRRDDPVLREDWVRAGRKDQGVLQAWRRQADFREEAARPGHSNSGGGGATSDGSPSRGAGSGDERGIAPGCDDGLWLWWLS